MQSDFYLDGIDVVPPKEPVTITLEIQPDELELAFATRGDALREKLLGGFDTGYAGRHGRHVRSAAPGSESGKLRWQPGVMRQGSG